MSDQTLSLWMDSGVLVHYPPLAGNDRADVCVVGAGISGISTAYLLAREGLRVIVLDSGPVGGGETGRTTAHLASALDDRFVELERLYGEDGARAAADSHRAAIDLIEQIVAQESISCDFERLNGYLFVPPKESTAILFREAEAARRAGIDCEIEEKAPIPDFETGTALRFGGQAQFHPLRYVAALARCIERFGGELHSGTRVTDVRAGKPGVVITEAGHTVSAGAIVIATNTPVIDRFVIHTKQAPYRTYAISAPVPQGYVHRALFWDTADPYHYVRIHSETAPELVVGGEDHKTGQGQQGHDHFAALESWARERFPKMGRVSNRWSGQVMEPVDGLAFIGRNPLDESSIYIATGDSGHGMTHGTIAGMLIRDLILGRPNPWVKLYDPSRKTISAAGEFIKENVNVARQYLDWITGGDKDSVEQVPRGSGAVLGKRAVYRDLDGRLRELSAVCPHLGCLVAWNAVEETWDCPCHGSRFDTDGQVINGPANIPLAKPSDENGKLTTAGKVDRVKR